MSRRATVAKISRGALLPALVQTKHTSESIDTVPLPWLSQNSVRSLAFFRRAALWPSGRANETITQGRGFTSTRSSITEE